jgi:ABC-type anion transport system duplicated permease subunit
MVDAFGRGDTAALWGSLGLMSLLVVGTHKLVWGPLYALAGRRFHLDSA